MLVLFCVVLRTFFIEWKAAIQKKIKQKEKKGGNIKYTFIFYYPDRRNVHKTIRIV